MHNQCPLFRAYPVRKARDEEWKEPAHPQYECREQIRKIAAAYKEITIEQKISLRDNSDHEDLIACRRGIERHAPSKGQGMLPAQQLAVNMCYDNLRRQNPNIPSPPRLPGTPPPSGPRSPAAGFAGSAPRTNISSFSPGDLKAPADDADPDFLPESPDSSRFSPIGFAPGASPAGSGGGPGGGGGPSSGGGPGGGSETGGEGDFAGLSPTEGFGFAPRAGGEGGEGGGDPWAEAGGGKGEGKGKKGLEEEVEELRKLPPEYLDLDEKDLIRAMTPPGKHENIFEYHSFFLHWYCRTYGCADYAELMGFPADWKPKKPRLLKVYDKELREKGAQAISNKNEEGQKADKDPR